MKIYGHDYEEWKKELLENIDADQLPASYSGSMTDPDGNPNCVTKIKPNKYSDVYITVSKMIFFNATRQSADKLLLVQQETRR